MISFQKRIDTFVQEAALKFSISIIKVFPAVFQTLFQYFTKLLFDSNFDRILDSMGGIFLDFIKHQSFTPDKYSAFHSFLLSQLEYAGKYVEDLLSQDLYSDEEEDHVFNYLWDLIYECKELAIKFPQLYPQTFAEIVNVFSSSSQKDQSIFQKFFFGFLSDSLEYGPLFPQAVNFFNILCDSFIHPDNAVQRICLYGAGRIAIRFVDFPSEFFISCLDRIRNWLFSNSKSEELVEASDSAISSYVIILEYLVSKRFDCSPYFEELLNFLPVQTDKDEVVVVYSRIFSLLSKKSMFQCILSIIIKVNLTEAFLLYSEIQY